MPPQDVVEILKAKYGYSTYLAEAIWNSLGSSALTFAESERQQVLKSIRVNTLKTDANTLLSRLEYKGFKLKKAEWTKTGYWVLKEPARPTLGSTEEYLCGHYFIQSLASIYTVEALNPRPGETVLDMAAGPGGKTTHISQLMDNTGTVVAVEPKRDRVAALRSNISRMGCENTVVLQTDGRNVPELDVKFDRILVDAPCTGTGLISLYPSLKTRVTHEDVEALTALQSGLLEAATNVLKKGGELVYSTCSILPQEGEQVVTRASDADLKIVPLTLPLATDEKYSTTPLDGAVRFYHHTTSTEGFFVCKMRKE
ncbi:MAG: RsmB/NOP family class I SAM-dependent RNA methyltransferase [Thermoprotei archaeon]